MANLDKLIGLNGAVAAIEFTLDGDLITYKGELSEDIANMIAKTSAANFLMGAIQAESFTRFNKAAWIPFHGWAFAAGDYSVCVMGHIGVLIETAKADFNEIISLLGEEAHITPRAA
jgi:roadblock/LC7 domain-containing protein